MSVRRTRVLAHEALRQGARRAHFAGTHQGFHCQGVAFLSEYAARVLFTVLLRNRKGLTGTTRQRRPGTAQKVDFGGLCWRTSYRRYRSAWRSRPRRRWSERGSLLRCVR